VAVSLAAFNSYYDREAETWEMLALTRARVVWSSSGAFAADVAGAVETALRRPRDAVRTAVDVREMRDLMEAERPPSGFWDLKLSPGGLVDIEFAAQHLQIIHAAAGGPLEQNTGAALAALEAAGLGDPATLRDLLEAWRLQQDLAQLLKLALDDRADPENEPRGLQALLARAGGARDLKGLRRRLGSDRDKARRAFEAVTLP
jgi:glutamate-ammonia-ligase adenylyltransferase